MMETILIIIWSIGYIVAYKEMKKARGDNPKVNNNWIDVIVTIVASFLSWLTVAIIYLIDHENKLNSIKPPKWL